MSDEIKNGFEENNEPKGYDVSSVNETAKNENDFEIEITAEEAAKAEAPETNIPPVTHAQAPHVAQRPIYNNPPMQGYYYAGPRQPMQPMQPVRPMQPMQPMQPMSAPMYNTNYYSSVNPNGIPAGAVYSYPGQVRPNAEQHKASTPASPQKEEKKKEKKGHGIMLVICCAVLSLVCGFVAAFGAMKLFKYTDHLTDGATNPGGTTVIYESVQIDVPESSLNAGAVATVANIALPSVVEIRTEAVVNNSFYGQYVTEGAGSGVIISTDGYIVTNNHVISGASNITVRLYNGDEFKAELIGKDAQTDIAVIKINAENLTPVIMGESTNLVIGELTVAIGNPLGELGGTVTDGIISALDREITVEGENMILLQTNAAVSPGNSGGGLFNAKGELIGIVNAKSSGSSVEGLGFAIPITTAKPVIKDLIEKGHVTGRPSIGITIIEITSDYQKYMYGVSDYGVYIQQALNEEFQAGDRIIAIDGNSISTSSDIKAILHEHTVGDKITVTVSRKNKIVDVEVTLIDSADNTLSTQ